MSSNYWEKRIRPDLAEMGAYSAHTAPETLARPAGTSRIVKLDANENPYGCSPGTLKALADYRGWNIYPDAAQTALRQALADYTGADAAQIVAADGSGELLDDLLVLLVSPGDEVINCTPTFDLYRVRTLVNEGRIINVPRGEDFSVDAEAIKAAINPRTKLIIAANPNNPTGNAMTKNDITALANSGVPLLIDEAYYEFCGESCLPLMANYPNLMVLRTFSKWAGIAGLRIGYGIFPPEIAACLLKVKLPYNVSVAADVAARASLIDADILMDRVQNITDARQRLYRQLQELSWLTPLPSRANFIFCFLKTMNGAALKEKMQQRGILIRYFDQPRLENGFRVSVGTPEQNDIFLAALREIEEEL